LGRILDRILRRIVPSTVLLSRSTVFAATSRAVDVIVRPFVGLFTSQPIPPLRFLVRTGVVNNIFAPHYEYLTAFAKTIEPMAGCKHIGLNGG
jgi:hypothetical protein